ncbi:MAG: peptidoglycan-binding protein [Alicyclobacillus sp.]|nr:peptidoglycan-binding protein [Alicyclobacillus sp.]
MAAMAIDVSNHNGDIDWTRVKAAGVSLAWTKATEGTDYLDAYLSRNLAGMRSVGIQDGTYHFARPMVGRANVEADWYVDSVLKAGGFGALAPVLDIEVTGGLSRAQLTTWMANWLARVEQRTGRVPVIYTYTSFGQSAFDSTQFTRYPLWIADYGVSKPALPPGWTSWAYWQYSDSGHVDGIAGVVDMDYIAGEVPQVAQTLQVGSTGDAVRTLQQELKEVLGLGSTFAVDGQYGPATAAAVKSFQLQAKLTVDGIAGPQTLAALQAAVKAAEAPKTTAPAQASTAPAAPTTATTQPTQTSTTAEPDAAEIKAKVAQVQQLLTQVDAILKTI